MVTVQFSRQEKASMVRGAGLGDAASAACGADPATRPYFQASKDSPVADFIAEADRHPVFALTPLGEASAGDTAQASRP